MLTLYQFPISHYCEKVRWALDFKHLDYQVKNLIPGLHLSKTKKLARSSSVPILVHDGKIVQNSSDIISYIDAEFPEFPLLPEQENLQLEAMAWEKFADDEIGITVRLICYHHLLDYPSLAIPLFTGNGPWYGPLVIKAIYPGLQTAMRNMMSINPESVQAANIKLGLAIDRVYTRLQEQSFLAGDNFTRADLATASLLAPLCMPKKYGLIWPERFPEPLEQIIEPYLEKIAWVNRLYINYR